MESTYKAEPLSRKTIREITKCLRSLCGIDEHQEFPVVRFMEFLLEKHGYIYDICSEEELPRDYARTIPAEKILQVRDDVYKEAVNGNTRHIFTIAHEIGHAILHDFDTVSFARADEKVRIYENPEWQANTFAGELIAPADTISELSIEEIAERYNCSMQVALIQKKNSEPKKKLPNGLKVW